MVINSYKYDVIRQALQEIKNTLGVSIYDDTSILNRDKPLTFTVNWSAHGKVSYNEASIYASYITEAAGIAHRLCDYKLSVDYSAKNPGNDHYMEDVEKVYKALMNIDNYSLTAWIQDREEV